MELLDLKGIQAIEPRARGVKAIWSPQTGIVSYREVTKCYVKQFRAMGGVTHFGFPVASIREDGERLVVKSAADEEVGLCSRSLPILICRCVLGEKRQRSAAKIRCGVA